MRSLLEATCAAEHKEALFSLVLDLQRHEDAIDARL